jgi:hypothetical protein
LGACGGNCGCGGARHDAGARPTLEPTPPTQEEIRLWVIEQFRKAGRIAPAEIDGRAFLIARYLAKGQPVPASLEAANTGASRGATRTRAETIHDMEDTMKEIERLANELPGPTRSEQQQYAVPTPSDAALADTDPDNKSPDGDPHGDAKIMRRRRATELERLIRENRKLARAKAPNSAARAKWDAEYQELNSELAAIREAERQERDQYKQV